MHPSCNYIRLPITIKITDIQCNNVSRCVGYVMGYELHVAFVLKPDKAL